MATPVFIHSGRTGQAGVTVNLNATVEDFVLLFQDDLKEIIDTFRSFLAIDICYNRFVPKPGKSRFAMIRFDSHADNPDDQTVNYTFQIILGRFTNRTAQQSVNPGVFTVEYSYERLLRLIKANGRLNGLAGITRLVGTEGGISPPGGNLFIPGPNVEEAVIAITYARQEPQLLNSNR